MGCFDSFAGSTAASEYSRLVFGLALRRTGDAAVVCRLVLSEVTRSERLRQMHCMQLSLARAADSLADSVVAGMADFALSPEGRVAAESYIGDDRCDCLGSSSVGNIDDFHFAHTDWSEKAVASIGRSVVERTHCAEK